MDEYDTVGFGYTGYSVRPTIYLIPYKFQTELPDTSIDVGNISGVKYIYVTGSVSGNIKTKVYTADVMIG